MNSRAILGLAGLSLVGAVIAGYWGFTLSRQPAAAPVVAQTGIVTPAAATPQAAAPQEEDTRQPVVVLLHDVNNPLSLFLSSGVLACTLEYASSWAIEKLYHMRFWDYSGKPFNINGRICLLYSLFWGALGIFWIKDIYPFMAKWILKLPNRAGKILTWVLSIFLAVNCLVSAAAVYRWSERLHDEPPKTWIGSVMDARFPNERMERIYANMNFGDSE